MMKFQLSLVLLGASVSSALAFHGPPPPPPPPPVPAPPVFQNPDAAPTRTTTDPGETTGRNTNPSGVPNVARTRGQATAAHGFVPGQSSNLVWNSHAPKQQRPTMLYVYNCEDCKGDGYDFAKHLEQSILAHQKVERKSDQFNCLKVCYKSPYFANRDYLKTGKKQAQIQSYLLRLSQLEEINTHVAFLDARGNLLSKVEGAKMLNRGGWKTMIKSMDSASTAEKKRAKATVF